MSRLLMISADPKIFEPGSQVALRQIELGKKWDEVHIVVFNRRGNGKQEIGNREIALAQNVWAYSTGSSFKFLNPINATRLGRFIINKRGITHITTQDPFLTGMTGTSLKREFPQLHLEIQLHTDIGAPHYVYTLGNKLRKAMALSYLPQADSIRVVSQRSKKFLTESLGISTDKIEVRPIPVDIEKIKNAPILEDSDLRKKYPQFKKIVLMASRLEPEKNVQLAISAWPKVVAQIPEAGLIVVGDGSQRAILEKQAIQLGLASSGGDLVSKNTIVFEGWATQETLASYYKTADLYLLTSLFEGYGMTLVEAHAAGIKIVSTDVGVAREVGATVVDWTVDDVAAKIVYSLGNG